MMILARRYPSLLCRRFYRGSHNKVDVVEKDVAVHIGTGIGIASGLLGSLCGVGGGLVIIPALKHFTNISIHKITGTSLAAVTTASLFASFSYVHQGVADIGIATLLGLSAMLTSRYGTRMHLQLPKKTLQRLMAGGMLLTAPYMYNKPERTEAVQQKRIDTDDTTGGDWKLHLGRLAPRTVDELPRWFEGNAHFCIVGAVVGFSTSLLGIGGGIIMTTLLGSFSELTQLEAVATSLVAMVPIGFSSAIWHYKARNLRVRSATIVGAAASLSMFIGASFVAPQIDEMKLRKIFAILLSLSSLQMLR